MVRLILPAGEWDQAATWTLVAGGDIMPDRGTYEQVTLEGKGVDYPWDGGTVSITGHHCCTPFGWPVTESKRTGNKGAVRGLFNDADIAMANLEGPVKDNFSYHTHGFTFTGDPRLVQGFVGAGFDFLSLANNHIGNGGASGLRDTIRHLNDAGIAHAGAGANIDAAAKPAYLAANGTRVAVVSCSEVGGFRAGPDKTGMLRCSAPQTLEAINEARAKADVVIVFPHWGAEYRAKPTASQRNLAANWAAAGVDVVLGSHPHWAEAIDEIDGTLVVYCMGNLVFDQTWSENTLEGLIVELTFQGDRLVQAWLHPTLILSAVQPNLLNHDAGGSDVLTRVRQASQGLFDY
jgi:poly-gamma-glutamate synthesis protein (capsule biosynthesis protein)